MSLGLDGDRPRVGEVEVGFRGGWLRSLRIVLSGAGWAAVILALFELIDKQPVEGVKLLAAWGPWPLLGLGFLLIMGQFLNQVGQGLQTTFKAVVDNARQTTESAKQSAEAHTKTAEALSRVADQGARHAQEIERLTIYAVQEFPIVHERLDKQDSMLQKIYAQVTKGKDDEEDAS